jgi:hypothetical protein
VGALRRPHFFVSALHRAFHGPPFGRFNSTLSRVEAPSGLTPPGPHFFLALAMSYCGNRERYGAPTVEC